MLGAGVVAPVGVAAALVPARTSLPATLPALVLVAVVVAVAANGHRAAGWLAALSSAVWFDFFLTAPYQRFTITHRADIETTLVLIAVGVAVTELAVRGRRHRMLVINDAAYLAAISSTSDLLATCDQPETVIEQINVQLTGLLGLRGCRFESGLASGLPRLGADGRVSFEGESLVLESLGMPRVGVEILVECGGVRYGRFILDPVPGMLAPLPARQSAVVLAAQAGAALASQRRTHLAASPATVGRSPRTVPGR